MNSSDMEALFAESSNTWLKLKSVSETDENENGTVLRCGIERHLSDWVLQQPS